MPTKKVTKKPVKKSKCDCGSKGCPDCNPKSKTKKKGGCCGCCR